MDDDLDALRRRLEQHDQALEACATEINRLHVLLDGLHTSTPETT